MRSSIDKFSISTVRHRLATGALALALLSVLGGQGFALSELGPGRTPQAPVAGDGAVPGAGDTLDVPDDVIGLPDPDPLINTPDPDEPATEPAATEPGVDTAVEPVDVITDINQAPEPVRRMRQLIVEAAASGDITRLKPLMNPGPNQTLVMTPDSEVDPVEALKALSGDPEGAEILAIMLDILATGFVKVDPGTPDEAYVWPYFAEKSVTTLSPPEKVELLRIVTAGDFADMLELGNYNFFRIGITPDGQWKFFTAGD